MVTGCTFGVDAATVFSLASTADAIGVLAIGVGTAGTGLAGTGTTTGVVFTETGIGTTGCFGATDAAAVGFTNGGGAAMATGAGVAGTGVAVVSGLGATGALAIGVGTATAVCFTGADTEVEITAGVGVVLGGTTGETGAFAKGAETTTGACLADEGAVTVVSGDAGAVVEIFTTGKDAAPGTGLAGAEAAWTTPLETIPISNAYLLDMFFTFRSSLSFASVLRRAKATFNLYGASPGKKGSCLVLVCGAYRNSRSTGADTVVPWVEPGGWTGHM